MKSIKAEIDSNFVGVAFFGSTFVAFLYGITTAQSFRFWACSKFDGWLLISLVLLLWLIDGLHCALVAWSAFAWAIPDRFNILGILFESDWEYRATVIATGASNFVVRGIYIHRIWKLGRNKYVTATLTFTSTVNFGLALAVAFAALHENNLIKTLLAMSPEIYASLACFVFSDALLVATICALLAQHHNASPRTKHIIHSLILYSVESGLTTSIASIACLIAYATLMPNNGCFLAIFAILPKLALNSMLAMLNARASLRTTHDNVVSPPGHGTTLLQHLRMKTSMPTSRINVNIEEEIELHTDSIFVSGDRTTQLAEGARMVVLTPNH